MNTLPTGYAETMDKLARPDNWDVPGLIADIAEGLRLESDNGAALAVIDAMRFGMQDIAQRIAHGHATRIDPTTIQEAADIATTFVDK